MYARNGFVYCVQNNNDHLLTVFYLLESFNFIIALPVRHMQLRLILFLIGHYEIEY